MKAKVVVYVIGLAVLASVWHWWPSDERRIRRLVGEMAAVFDGSPAGAGLEGVARLAPLARALSPDVVVDGLAPDGTIADAALTGRDAVLGAAAGALRLVPDLLVDVEDVRVAVAPRVADATAIAGVVVSGSAADGGWRDIRELRFELARHEDGWLVTRVTPVRPLRP